MWLILIVSIKLYGGGINSERLTIGADNSVVEIVSVDTVKINVLHSVFNLV